MKRPRRGVRPVGELLATPGSELATRPLPSVGRVEVGDGTR